MKKSKFSEEQVAYALRKIENCRPVARHLGLHLLVKRSPMLDQR